MLINSGGTASTVCIGDVRRGVQDLECGLSEAYLQYGLIEDMRSELRRGCLVEGVQEEDIR